MPFFSPEDYDGRWTASNAVPPPNRQCLASVAHAQCVLVAVVEVPEHLAESTAVTCG